MGLAAWWYGGNHSVLEAVSLIGIIDMHGGYFEWHDTKFTLETCALTVLGKIAYFIGHICRTKMCACNGTSK